MQGRSGMILNILFTIFIIAILIIWCAQEQNNRSRILEYFLIGDCISGVIIYGYCYSYVEEKSYIVIVKTIFATLNMFLGQNDFNTIREIPIMQQNEIICIYWIIHIIAMFVTATALLTFVGKRGLRRLSRYECSLSQYINVIYGSSDECINFAKTINDSKEKIIFIDERIEVERQNIIESYGWLSISLNQESHFIKIRRNARQLNVFCLKQNASDNIEFANWFASSVQKNRDKISNMALTILADMEIVDGKDFQKGKENENGYDTVLVLDRAFLVGKTLIDNYPPCRCVRFNNMCEADHGFHVVLIGFDEVQQAILKSLYKNGQFLSQHFKVTIFEKEYERKNGYFSNMNPEIFDNFMQPCVEVNPCDVQSEEFFHYLKRNKMDYLIIGPDNIQQKVVNINQIHAFVCRYNIDVDIFECFLDGIRHYDNGIISIHEVFTYENLCINELDKRAMEINFAYLSESQKNEISKQDAWSSTTYFEKMSCRSAADFISTYEYVIAQNNKKWNLEQLAKMEHLRWCAFYFASGYRVMTKDEFLNRSSEFLKGENSDIKFHKSEKDYLHACLIPWEDLLDLDRKQNLVYEQRKIDKRVNYQESDYKNVEIIREIIEQKKGE